jgi:predicted nucleic acid-binding protein
MILDTYAWIEFFKGSERGKKVEDILKKERCYTSAVSLAEIVEWCFKNNLEQKIEEYVVKIKNGTLVIFLGDIISTLAGKLNYERKKKIRGWGMLDSFILASANLNNLKILTGDKHFRDLPNVIML